MKTWLPLLVIIGLVVYARRVNMSYCFRQIKPASKMDANEYARTICMRDGEVFWGSEAQGEPLSVSLHTNCPDGKAIGVIHSHPGGTAEPSRQDIAEMLRARLSWLCVHGEDALRCYRVE